MLFSLAFTIVFCVRWFRPHPETAKTMRETDSTTKTGGISDSASLGQETAVTIILTVFLLLVRIYFTFVIIAYARQLVRQQNLRRYNGTPRGSFRAMLQNGLLAPFESFWTGFTSNSSASYSPLINTRSSSGPGFHRVLNSVSSGTTLLNDPRYELDELEDEDHGEARSPSGRGSTLPARSISDEELEKL